MLTALVAALVLAAPYWLFVPARLRQPAVAGASLAALATFDLRVALVVLAVAGGVFGQMRLAGRARQGVSVAFALGRPVQQMTQAGREASRSLPRGNRTIGFDPW